MLPLLVLLLAASCSSTDGYEEVPMDYGSSFSIHIPRKADFLEYTSSDRGPPLILWNRTNPQTGSGGRRKFSYNSWEMVEVTQEDSGYYNVRRKDRTLISKTKLIVQEQTATEVKTVHDDIRITFPLEPDLCDLTFVPKWEGPQQLMNAGDLLYDHGFYGRLSKRSFGVTIENLKSTDTGRFEVRDHNGNLALTVWLDVEEFPVPTSLIIGVAVGIVVAVVVCCCCVRKRCCKKSSKRGNSVPQTAAAPAVSYRDATSHPSGAMYSAAPYAPVYPALSSLGAPVHSPAKTHVSSPKPEVAALGGGRAAATSTILGSDNLSSSPDLQFTIKGFSAAPLSSDTTYSDVYNSDKLNFL